MIAQATAAVLAAPASGEDTKVVPFPGQLPENVVELQELVRSLQEENKELSRQVFSYGTFIRTLGQRYFAIDEQSRYFAAMALGRPVSDREAMDHWRKNGGPEHFSRMFPTPESVRRSFSMAHAVKKALARLNIIIP